MSGSFGKRVDQQLRNRDVVAAFDFDGTLTVVDTLIGFLARSAPLARWASGWAATGWWGSRLLLGRIDNSAFKSAVVRAWLKGARTDRVERRARKHARLVTRFLRGSAVACVRAHQELGHRVFVLSASPAVFVRPVVRTLGIEANQVLATELAVAGDRYTGRLQGLNCYGPEKLRRLRPHLGSATTLYAYGDSCGDRDVLAAASHPRFRCFSLPSDMTD
jgi:phosphatidylglycerophosphatase C